MKTWEWTVKLKAIGKPRMTQRDRWKKRPRVMAYRAWADELRILSPKDLPERPRILEVHSLIPMPKSWTKKKQAEKFGGLHDEKPDADNIAKAICDILFVEDKTIGAMHIKSYWVMPEDTPQITIKVMGE